MNEEGRQEMRDRGFSEESIAKVERGLSELANKPRERCGELEAEVARLRGLVVESIQFVGWGSCPDGLVDRMHDAVAALTPDADAKGGH